MSDAADPPRDPGILLKRASQGDRPAIDELLQRYLPGLRAFIRQRAGPVIRRRESESDLAQSVCREVLEHADRFEFGDEPGFKRWLYTEALRKILDRYEYYTAQKRDFRRETPLDRLSSSDLQRTFSTPSQFAIKKEELARVEHAFDALSEEQREVISLAHVAGLSRGEIAKRLGKSEGAVRTMLSRALAQLSEILDDEGPPAASP
jgi:RNA polymerase sigma-70 factor (ECF subfamily)